MKRLALLFILAVTPARADECDTRAANAATEIDAAISPRTATGYILENGKTEKFRLSCMGGQVSGISGTKMNSEPVQAFVQKVARITSTTVAVDEQAVISGILRCIRQAGDSGRLQKISNRDLAIECLVLVDDLTLILERRP